MIKTDDIDKVKLYWTLQVAGWSLFCLIYSLFTGNLAGFSWPVLGIYIIIAIAGLLITHFYRWYVSKNKWTQYGIFALAVRVILASSLLSGLWLVIALPINYALFVETEGGDTQTAIYIVLQWFNLFIVILSWSLIYFTFQFFFTFKKTEVEKWKLEVAVKEAELIALKSQINPHFIFNSLNNIRSLVIENPEKARDMITHLSGLLRYSVQFNTREKVRLEDELEIVQNYLNLESIQFEDRLRYKLEIKPETLDIRIPPMAIQLLVENAIKHGISNLPEGGEINVKSFLQDGSLIVEVTNTGQLQERSNGTGIGLKNASDRLSLLFGKLSDLKIQNIDSRHVSARFTIPLN